MDCGTLRVTTPGWHCEGAVDVAAGYLLCSSEGRVADRIELEMAFVPEDTPRTA